MRSVGHVSLELTDRMTELAATTWTIPFRHCILGVPSCASSFQQLCSSNQARLRFGKNKHSSHNSFMLCFNNRNRIYFKDTSVPLLLFSSTTTEISYFLHPKITFRRSGDPKMENALVHTMDTRVPYGVWTVTDLHVVF